MVRTMSLLALEASEDEEKRWCPERSHSHPVPQTSAPDANFDNVNAQRWRWFDQTLKGMNIGGVQNLLGAPASCWIMMRCIPVM
jgi:hypothetical protein